MRFSVSKNRLPRAEVSSSDCKRITLQCFAREQVVLSKRIIEKWFFMDFSTFLFSVLDFVVLSRWNIHNGTDPFPCAICPVFAWRCSEVVKQKIPCYSQHLLGITLHTGICWRRFTGWSDEMASRLEILFVWSNLESCVLFSPFWKR